MIDSTKIVFEKGTWKYRLAAWFINNVNFCHGLRIDGTPKPDNKVYNAFYKYWLWPFQQTDCICCNTVRGLLYGFAAGFLLRGLL